MLDYIYREFAIAVIPTKVKVIESGYERTRIESDISITEIATGKSWIKHTISRVTSEGLESIILTTFPESQSAKEIKNYRDLTLVVLSEHCDASYVAEGMHTALRKLCDTKASSFWWNMIHNLPTGVMGEVWTATATALIAVGYEAPLTAYANAVEQAWITTFDKIVNASEAYASNRCIYTEYVIGNFDTDYFDDMTAKEFKSFKEAVKMAYLALDYLQDDWACMLGYITDAKKD